MNRLILFTSNYINKMKLKNKVIVFMFISNYSLRFTNTKTKKTKRMYFINSKKKLVVKNIHCLFKFGFSLTLKSKYTFYRQLVTFQSIE